MVGGHVPSKSFGIISTSFRQKVQNFSCTLPYVLACNTPSSIKNGRVRLKLFYTNIEGSRHSIAITGHRNTWATLKLIKKISSPNNCERPPPLSCSFAKRRYLCLYIFKASPLTNLLSLFRARWCGSQNPFASTYGFISLGAYKALWDIGEGASQLSHSSLSVSLS